MKINIVALISGIIFGLGLCISQMINPQVIISFVDITGNWDPSLAFVMIGALCVTFVTFPLILKRQKPVCCDDFSLPTSNLVDKSLIIGAVLFGVGWGLAGICPGPAVSALVFGLPKSFVFFVAMLGGMGIYQWLFSRR